MPNAPVQALAVSGTNLFAGYNGNGANGGVFISTNNGSSWSAVNFGLTNINSYCTIVNALAASGMNLFAGTFAGVCLSTNDGSWWSAANSGLQVDISALAVSGTNLFAGTAGGNVFLSTDNGTSWIYAGSGSVDGNSIPVFSLLVSGANLFNGTNGGGVFLSTNNGSSWSAVNTGLTDTTVYGLAVSGTNLLAGVGSAGVWMLPLSDIPLSVQAGGSKAVAANGSVVLTWRTQSEVNNIGFNVIRKDADTGVSSLIASYTSDASLRGLGTSTSGKEYSYKDTHIVDGQTYDYTVESVASDGSMKDYPAIEVNIDRPKSYALYQNFPNPFNPSTVIKYQLPRTTLVSLKLYDVLGREVRTLVNQRQAAGTYSVTFNAGNLSSGVYFYRLQAGAYYDAKKLLLLK